MIKSALGAGLTVLCGLLLWGTSLGEPWTNASYDYLFRFGSRALTNEVTFILMDSEAFDHFHQARSEPWSRALHAQLLNRLADDGCAMVVCDAFFRTARNPETDDALAKAMARQKRIVLMAEQAQVTHPDVAGAYPVLPLEKFLQAAGTNHWGVAWLDPDVDQVVRKHWPFPADGPYPSLPETAARVWGVTVPTDHSGRWLRYYDENGPGTKLSYRFALSQPPGFYRDQIVFIGLNPKTSLSDGEPDEFCVPYTRWTGKTSGGVQIMATAFLNLVQGDWLQRPPAWWELAGLVVSGILLGAGLCRLKPWLAVLAALAFAGVVALGAVMWGYYGSHWFPWLIISGAQAPCALAVMLVAQVTFAPKSKEAKTAVMEKPPVTPGYTLIQPAIGEGAYGRVWLARDKSGQWWALKAVYLANFNQNTGPYEREFDGVARYQAVSGKHPGLLRVDFVSEKRDGYFYYVMELGDSLTPGWHKNPSLYKPHDLFAERARAAGQRLPVRDCVRLGLELAETLEFLHQNGLTHRDIKPQNIIFVNGRPKLADVGLIADIRPHDQIKTLVGTPGYMPPPPERPGTPQADIFALGMVLYVLSTGRTPEAFPDISTTLIDNRKPDGFFRLNAVILKACQPDAASRYATAAELHKALLALVEENR